MLSRIAASGQDPTQARHIVHVSRLITMPPNGDPGGSGITFCGTGACAARCSMRERRGGALFGGGRERRRDARSERGRPGRERVERCRHRPAGSARPDSPARWRWCRRAHLERQRLAILRRFAAGREHGDLRGAPRQRREPDVEARRRRRDGSRAESRAPASPLPRRARRAIASRPSSAWSSRHASRPPALRVGREQRLDPRREIGHRRIGVGQRARRAHGRARAAADAQVRLDRDAIAVGPDGERRADVDALRAASVFATGCARRSTPCS